MAYGTGGYTGDDGFAKFCGGCFIVGNILYGVGLYNGWPSGFREWVLCTTGTFVAACLLIAAVFAAVCVVALAWMLLVGVVLFVADAGQTAWAVASWPFRRKRVDVPAISD